jgi:hypothetical protein
MSIFSQAPPDKSRWRKQVQLSLSERELADLTRLVELKKHTSHWDRGYLGYTTRSAVVVGLVTRELARMADEAAREKVQAAQTEKAVASQGSSRARRTKNTGAV